MHNFDLDMSLKALSTKNMPTIRKHYKIYQFFGIVANSTNYFTILHLIFGDVICSLFFLFLMFDINEIMKAILY
jgi:hypothetical protein